MPIGWVILPSFRAGVIACIRSDHMDDRGMQVPPPPDLEINAKDNLEQISNITDNRGNTEWLTYGHAPKYFHGRYGWELMDKIKKVRGNDLCLKQRHTLAHWVYFGSSASTSGWRTTFNGVDASWVRIKSMTSERYTLGMYLNNYGYWANGKVEILKEQWQLIIFVGKGSSASLSYGDVAGETKVYIGNQKMSPVLVSTINKAPTGDCINSVGYDNQSPGIISEFAIWNRALTISQINGYWEQTRFVNLVDAKLHIVNWGTRLNDVYHTDGVVHGRGGGSGNLPYIPYQVPPSSDSFVISAIKYIKIFLGVGGYAHSQIIGVA